MTSKIFISVVVTVISTNGTFYWLFIDVCIDELRIGLVSVSDRASGGIYEDKGIPYLEA